mmetsp:Transcript_28873/g.54125  ORF Transcript_28873/g.54125 Transcript_28873/m.54125 type:complete len:81 (+) Transcript_28873:277-519(+)
MWSYMQDEFHAACLITASMYELLLLSPNIMLHNTLQVQSRWPHPHQAVLSHENPSGHEGKYAQPVCRVTPLRRRETADER